MRRAALLLALGLAGCTLVLDTGKSGLPCDADGNCLDGYVCNANDVCVPLADGACQPACGAFEKCVRQQCVATCDNRPCGAAEYCSDGQCVARNNTGALGDACSTDAQCTDPGAFCLRTYGGGRGMCTKICGNDGDCSGDAASCLAYATGGSAQAKLCAPASFTACTKESDCASAQLSCGLFAIGPLKEGLLACRTRLTDSSNQPGKSIGEPCSPAIACANGLCEQTDGSGTKRCLTPCQAASDCADTLNDSGTDCLPVVAGLVSDTANGLPSVRVSMCVPGGASQLTSCAASAATCHADAPTCVPFASGKACAQSCSDSSPACPAPLHCDVADGNYCASSN